MFFSLTAFASHMIFFYAKSAEMRKTLIIKFSTFKLINENYSHRVYKSTLNGMAKFYDNKAALSAHYNDLIKMNKMNNCI